MNELMSSEREIMYEGKVQQQEAAWERGVHAGKHVKEGTESGSPPSLKGCSIGTINFSTQSNQPESSSNN